MSILIDLLMVNECHMFQLSVGDVVLRYSSACGRCFVCFVLDPVIVHSP